MKSKLESDYTVQFGCHNCANVFRFMEYDCGDEWYCTLNAPKRPRCMSVAMGEIPKTYKRNEPGYDRWERWREGRKVEAYGICGAWRATP